MPPEMVSEYGMVFMLLVMSSILHLVPEMQSVCGSLHIHKALNSSQVKEAEEFTVD
jgi:hypothetical protein